MIIKDQRDIPACYLAGPMRGYTEFNFPAFFKAEEMLLEKFPVVFNPARRDEDAHGGGFSVGNETGDAVQASEEHGFSLREALAADMAWICEHATAIYLLDGWEESSGACAEAALAVALGLDIYTGWEDAV